MTNGSVDTVLFMDRLNEWNNEQKRDLFPNTVILSIYILLGVTGNALVLFIYALRFKSQDNEERFFIPYLAAIDFMTCVLCSAGGLLMNTYPFNYNSDIKCKICCYLIMLFTCSSVLLLMIIAVHRYCKVCNPFGRQMTLKWKKISIVAIVIVTSTASIPCFVFYGVAPIHSQTWNVTGSRCTSIVGPYPKFASVIYKGTFLILCISIVCVLCILYILIGRVIYKQMKFRSTLFGISRVGNSASETTTTSKNTLGLQCSISLDQAADFHNKGKFSSTTVIEKTSQPNHRSAVMFMIITVIFVISFIPKVVLMVIESKQVDFWLTLSPGEMTLYRFLYTVYITNNVVNPYIYGFFDAKFRKEFKSLFCRKC